MKLKPEHQGYLFFAVIAVVHTVAIGIMLFGLNGR
jgi:hypothetical protein